MGEQRDADRRGSNRRASKPDTDPAIGEPTFSELLRTLSSQKDSLRETQSLEAKESSLRLRRALAKERPTRGALAQSSSAPVLSLEKNSAWSAGCSYSFGKPRHRKGKYGIQVCEPRDEEYAQARLGGGYKIPGVGHYNLTSPDGLAQPDVAQGLTGGWPAAQHEAFTQTLRESRNEATPEFFRLLRQRLPEVPFWQICDHVRWYALRERAEAQKLRRIVRWRTEQDLGGSSVDSAAETREREEEKRRLARLLQRADEAEAEEGNELAEGRHFLPSAGRPRAVLMRNRQLGPGGAELAANLTGHPEMRRSPSYAFGASRDPRDYAAKRLTQNAHCRSTSALDNPGPGSYCGLDEKLRLMKTVPSWSLRPRLDRDTNDPSCPDQGPGYHGRLEGKGGELAWRRAQEDLRTIQTRKPTWKFGTEAQRFEKASSASPNFTDLRTPNTLGPGSYIGRG
mmetsp:Transcript_3215/g.8619  ORF Transcript_3215/g.8619 Transcript_3215/m.8619 type:complete len:454 (-) Transcript_3215:64-1425(-)